MKNQKPLFFTCLTVIVMSVLGTLCASLILQSEFFVNSKLFFAVFFLVASAIVSCLVFYVGNKQEQKEHTETVNRYRREIDQCQQRIDTLQKQNTSLADQIRYYDGGLVQKGIKNLKEKCAALEAFRAKFPYTVCDGYILLGINRLEVNTSANSTWMIVGETDGVLWSYQLTRPAEQTYEGLMSLVELTASPQELELLNMDRRFGESEE